MIIYTDRQRGVQYGEKTENQRDNENRSNSSRVGYYCALMPLSLCLNTCCSYPPTPLGISSVHLYMQQLYLSVYAIYYTCDSLLECGTLIIRDGFHEIITNRISCHVYSTRSLILNFIYPLYNNDCSVIATFLFLMKIIHRVIQKNHRLNWGEKDIRPYVV